MGTETAISKVLDTIEKGMMKRQFAVGCFVDIASEFDKLNAEKATQALRRRGIDSYIVDWYGDYLRHRYAIVELKGIKRLLKINTGCPQGGVLSTLLRSVAFNDLLRKFDVGNVNGIRYTDDGSLIMCGQRLDAIFKELNIALQKCIDWAPPKQSVQCHILAGAPSSRQPSDRNYSARTWLYVVQWDSPIPGVDQ